MWKANDRPQISTAIIGHRGRWEMEFHRHAGFEISVVLEGGGCMQTDDAVVSLEAGHVALLPPDVPHRFWTTNSIRFGVLHADRLEEETKELFRTMTPGGRPRVLYLSPLELETYESLFRGWLRAVSQPLREREQTIGTWIRLLLLTLLQSADTGSRPLSVVGAADYIRENVGRPVHIQELAKLAGLSESSFRRLFLETFGVTPKQYLQRCRLTESKWLLRASNKPIQSIAEQTGFLSVHAFSAWFQRMTGVPPGKWRKRQQGETEAPEQG